MRVEQFQILVYLGGGANRRARIVVYNLLLYGNGRRYAVDKIDLGLIVPPQELPDVARQRLDIAALPLGIEGVECQRRLAGARKPRNDHHFRTRNAHIHPLQVVNASIAYNYLIILIHVR